MGRTIPGIHPSIKESILNSKFVPNLNKTKECSIIL